MEKKTEFGCDNYSVEKLPSYKVGEGKKKEN